VLTPDKGKAGGEVGRHSPCMAEGQSGRRTLGGAPVLIPAQKADVQGPEHVGAGAAMVAAFTRAPTRTVGSHAMENNALKLTRPVEIGASQLNASVRRT
jgi:hypothetical protein